MKWILAVIWTSLVSFICSQHANMDDLEPLDEIDEKEFEEYFGLPSVDDREEYQRREAALKKNEAEIKKINEAYNNGESPWFDKLNEFANLPEEEFIKQKTGLSNIIEGRGLLKPLPHEEYHEESERYFGSVMRNENDVPDEYFATDKKLVSPVRNQGNCGSCVAFATMASIETCFRKKGKKGRVFADYSEQQMVDCAYGQHGANGCDGAAPQAYAVWASENQVGLCHETQYPYLGSQPKLQCPADLPTYNQGAEVSDAYYTYEGNEELLKALVYKHGAVVTGVKAEGPFENYGGGIFEGCPPGKGADHAITVVGYGTEEGTDYWLIKNSWGTEWGEEGYIRLKRGVNMCGIGDVIIISLCEKKDGPIDAPIKPKKQCKDTEGVNCWHLAKNDCHKKWVQKDCPKSCGLCDGMSLAASNNCYNKYSNCNDLADRCSWDERTRANCKITCNTC